MNKCIKAAVATVFFGILASCGGSDPRATSVSGVVADGYLRGAEVFLDRNGNYRWDAGEPRSVTGAGGVYTLKIATEDAGRYPVVARAIPGTTVDEDTGQAVGQGYVLSAPAGITGFISPMSSLVREKMANGTYASMEQAMEELRKQLNLNPGVNVFANYVEQSADPQYLAMRDMAKYMAGILAGQLDMGTGATVNADRYRTLMGEINQNLPQMRYDMKNGMEPQAFMQKYDFTHLMTNMPGTMPGQGFRNMSSLFRNMTTARFWNLSGNQWRPMRGGMMGR